MINLRTRNGSGTSVLVYDQLGVRISLGAWTSIRIDGLRFEFDSDAFAWTEKSLAGMGAGTLAHEAFTVAARIATADTFRQVVRLFESAQRERYVEGVRDGERHKIEQIRELLDL